MKKLEEKNDLKKTLVLDRGRTKNWRSVFPKLSLPTQFFISLRIAIAPDNNGIIRIVEEEIVADR